MSETAAERFARDEGAEPEDRKDANYKNQPEERTLRDYVDDTTGESAEEEDAEPTEEP